MYMDEYVFSGIAIVVITCAILGVMGRYAYKHIKKDIAEADVQK